MNVTIQNARLQQVANALSDIGQDRPRGIAALLAVHARAVAKAMQEVEEARRDLIQAHDPPTPQGWESDAPQDVVDAVNELYRLDTEITVPLKLPAEYFVRDDATFRPESAVILWEAGLADEPTFD